VESPTQVLEPEPREEKTVTRYTDVSCPRHVWCNEDRISVVVRLTVQPTTHGVAIQPLDVQTAQPVKIRIHAPAFHLLNQPEQETRIVPGADSPPVAFDVRPARLGPTQITFDFIQQGNPLGTVSIPVDITPYQVHEESETRPAQLFRGNVSAEPPDLMLYVGYDHLSERRALTFTLLKLGEVGITFHDVHLQEEPRTQAERFYEQLTVLTDQEDPTLKKVTGEQRLIPSDDIDRRLKQFGQNLWRNLFPPEFRARYETERQTWRDRSLVIVSDEPYIPWELVWPYGRGWEDKGPWCLTLNLTRWLRRDAQGNGHEAPPAVLPLQALACLAPSDSGLAAAQHELELLMELLRHHALEDRSPSAFTRKRVLDLLESGEYDWLHAAAHGNFMPETPDADSALWLEDRAPLTPETFVGPAIEDHIYERRPRFVFNACHTGREAWALTQLGGWPNRLIASGAGLFMGPLWTVKDSSAYTFAEAFYESLLEGTTVARAVRQARMLTRQSGDPTWLAYSVYAHPNARVRLEEG